MIRRKVDKTAARWDNDMLDRVAAAFWAEHDRWALRCNGLKRRGSPYEIVRNASPNNDIVDESLLEVITFAKSECRDRFDADTWFDRYRNRAAIRAALEAM